MTEYVYESVYEYVIYVIYNEVYVSVYEYKVTRSIFEHLGDLVCACVSLIFKCCEMCRVYSLSLYQLVNFSA